MNNYKMVSARQLMLFLMALLFILPLISYAETYSYDNTGRLTGVTYDDNSTITYTYDNNGNILGKTIGTAPVVIPPPPAPPPATGTTAIFGLNAFFFNTGSPLTLSGAVTPGPLAGTVVDAYVTVRTPAGMVLYLLLNGTVTQTPTPYVSNWSLAQFSGVVFNYVFAGTEPTGIYVVNGFLTLSGTMTPVGSVTGNSFTFMP